MRDFFLALLAITFCFLVFLYFPAYTFGHCLNNSKMKTADNVLACGMVIFVYPLYWSWEVQTPKEDVK